MHCNKCDVEVQPSARSIQYKKCLSQPIFNGDGSDFV